MVTDNYYGIQVPQGYHPQQGTTHANVNSATTGRDPKYPKLSLIVHWMQTVTRATPCSGQRNTLLLQKKEGRQVLPPYYLHR